MNVYIDLGCYDGDTVKQWRNWSKIHYGEKDWKIIAFDANPKFKDDWSKIESENDNVEFHLKAAWIEDTELEFAVDQTDTPLGSTLMKSKVKIWDNSPKIKVEAFDFSQWLRRYENDLVVVKIDCEGAEFKILQKMIDDGTIYIPNRLMVEFHPNKVREYTTTDMNNLIKKIRDMGVKLEVWH